MQKFILCMFILFFSNCFANDYLYSDAYFDYLIECAQEEYNQKVEAREKTEESPIEFVDDDSLITEDYEPFKLHIQSDSSVSPYFETFKKQDTKTIVPLSDSVSFFQDLSQAKNKYNSTDYKILTGVDINAAQFLNFAAGLETNFRGLDQNPLSRKVYFTPSVNLGDKVSVSFHNKMNVQNYSTDHDIGLNISPFKSKFMDFGVYAGTTRNPSGMTSRSVNFSTNLYFF